MSFRSNIFGQKKIDAIPEVTYSEVYFFGGQTHFAHGSFISPDGKNYYASNYQNGWITHLNLKTPFNLYTAELISRSNSLAFGSWSVKGLTFTADGLRVLNISNTAIFQRDLLTPWNISAYTNLKTKAVGVTAGTGCGYSHDGTKLFISDSNNIKQAVLTTPFDIETLGAFSNLPRGGTSSVPGIEDFCFFNNGMGMAIASRSLNEPNSRIFYLQTPYDLESIDASKTLIVPNYPNTYSITVQGDWVYTNGNDWAQIWKINTL